MFEDYYLGNETRWEMPDADPGLVRALSNRTGLPALLVKVLVSRGFVNPDEIKRFIKPSIKTLHDPMLLPDMDKAVKRIICARTSREKVIVYGDYDVDGITATSILYSFLNSVGLNVSFYIPDRMDEGYGISETAVDYLSRNDFDLMITVDCGISARERIAQIYGRLAAQNRKMDIIITDHHQPNPDSLPEAVAAVNPHLPCSKYPFPKLCGAGIAFKLVQALCSVLGLEDRYLDFVDLAALGTIADIVEITGENRIIVWAGLKKIQRRPNRGIQALLSIAGIKERDVDSWNLAFILAPRVNAAGRMGDASRGVRLFTSHDPGEIESLAQELHQENYRRQKTQEDIFLMADEIINSNPLYKRQKVIVVYGNNWHHGVIGIVASMLVERYQKPCFVLSVEEDMATGSARSIDGFNIFHALEYCGELLVKYGGHEQAGGLTLRSADIDSFRVKINEFADMTLPEASLPTIRIDALADLDEIGMDAAEAVMALAPFGEGNPSPVFRLDDVTVLQKKRIGSDGSHMRLLLGGKSNSIQAIAFRMGELEPYIQLGQKLDLIFTTRINEYLGKRTVQLVIRALRVPESIIERNRVLAEAAEKVECLDYDEKWIYNGINNQRVKYEDISISRDELGVLYRFLQKSGDRTLNRAQLFQLAEEIGQDSAGINYFKLLSGLLIFDELGIIRFSLSDKGQYCLEIPETIEKASLQDSALYSFLQEVQRDIG